MKTVMRYINRKSSVLAVPMAVVMVAIEIVLLPASIVLMIFGATVGALWRAFIDGWDSCD